MAKTKTQKSKTQKVRSQGTNVKADNRPQSEISSHVLRGLKESFFMLLLAISVYLLISLYSYSPTDPGWSHSVAVETGKHSLINLGGRFGAWFADLIFYLFGVLSFLFPVMVAFTGILIFRDRNNRDFIHFWHLSFRSGGFIIALVAGCGLATLHFTELGHSYPMQSGGILGSLVAGQLKLWFSFVGSTLLLLTLFLIGITLFTGLSWLKLMDNIGGFVLWCYSLLTTRMVQWREYRARRRMEKAAELARKKSAYEKEKAAKAAKVPVIKTAADNKIAMDKQQSPAKTETPSVIEKAKLKIEPVFKAVEKSARMEKNRQGKLFQHDAVDGMPSLSLLEPPQPSKHVVSPQELEKLSRLIEVRLADYGIAVEVVAVNQGPVITRFEIQLAPGIKVSQITNLSKDLARALLVVSIRVVEVIAGKSTVGIEIPNAHRETVTLSEVLGTKAFGDSRAILPLALGHDISGHPVVVDMTRMPHLLVAGTTGAGKSVGVNAMILSMLFRATPDQLRLIMIDPKMLELSIYEGIPHLLAPVVTDMKEAANALRWCVAEMERRYKLMAAMGVRNIGGYNKKIDAAIDSGAPIKDPFYVPDPLSENDVTPELETMPFIVIIIDEFADMMMIVGKKVEELIARLAQKARAAGIHLILATQRPSVDVITGLIKANIPSRIAFQVSSKIDSRTILDQMGAENLLGHGDMLYLPPGTSLPQRVHGCFVSDNDVHAVVNDLKSRGKAEYLDEILNGDSLSAGGVFIPGEAEDESDPLYDEAVAIVTESRRASISGIQRRLKVGYNRAARMVEDMEKAGVVSPVQSNGQREVLAPAPPR